MSVAASSRVAGGLRPPPSLPATPRRDRARGARRSPCRRTATSSLRRSSQLGSRSLLGEIGAFLLESRRATRRRASPPPRARLPRRAQPRARDAAALHGTAPTGRAPAPSGRARRRAAGRRRPRRAARARRSATDARNGSSRVGSPGGAVAAIGRTGRIPYGRQSSRSKRTGPAATGAAVARRIAVTASASSPGASGTSSAPPPSERSSSSTQMRSGSRPKSRAAGRRLPATSRQALPWRPTRTRIPSPSSICVPTERPTSGATAPYEWPSPKSEPSISSYARANAESSQSKPPQPSAELDEERYENAAVDGASLAWTAVVRVREDPRRRLALEIPDARRRRRPARRAARRAPRRSHVRAGGTRRASAGRTSRAPRRRTEDRIRPRARGVKTAKAPRQKPAERVVEVRRAHPALLRRRRAPSYLWHSGHQYAVRAFSPCGAERTTSPQRGHGRPARR